MNSFVSGNYAENGGGVYDIAGTVSISNTTFCGNAAKMGGGLYVAGETVTISYSTFCGNDATDEGGAIYNGWNLAIINSTLSDNSVISNPADNPDGVQGGGAISNFGVLSVTNSTISDNYATSMGGGILNVGVTLDIQEGEGISNSELSLVNTIIANNVISDTYISNDCYNLDDGIVYDNGHNLIEDGVALVDGGCLDNATSLNGDAWLADLGDYGSDAEASVGLGLETHALLPNSPAINAGDDAYCPTTDQRTEARLGVCDIGAVESQGFTLDVIGGDDQNTQINTAFADPLEVLISANDLNLSIGADQVISFTAPISNASLDTTSFTGSTDWDDIASVWVAANGVAGSYAVTATANNVESAVTFNLTNTVSNATPALDALTSQTIRETYALSFTANASDTDNDPLTFSLSDAPTGATFDAGTGLFTWTPTDSQGPGIYTMTVTVSDDGNPALSDSEIITITVLDLPIVFDQDATTDEEQAVDFSLFASAANDPIIYTLSQPSHGTLSGTVPDLTYTPAPNFSGSDTFTFTVSDGLVQSAVATVLITVNPVNEAPTTSSQALTTDEDTPLSITLTSNDADGDVLTYTLVTSVLYGELGGIAPTLVYTPDGDFVGEDSFTFTVSDGVTTTAAAAVTITVNSVNDAPVANGQHVQTNEDLPLSIMLTGTDVDSDILTYTVVTQPLSGTLGGLLPNLVYTPDVDFNGSDSFTFQISDGISNAVTAVISITVNARNDAPTATAQSVNTAEDTVATITLARADADGDDLTYTVVIQPLHGAIGGIAPNLVYTPDVDFVGSDSFTFKVNDGAVDSAAATVSITVDPRNDAPVAAAQSVGTNEEELLAITLSGTDGDGDVLTYTVMTQFQPIHRPPLRPLPRQLRRQLLRQ